MCFDFPIKLDLSVFGLLRNLRKHTKKLGEHASSMQNSDNRPSTVSLSVIFRMYVFVVTFISHKKTSAEDKLKLKLKKKKNYMSDVIYCKQSHDHDHKMAFMEFFFFKYSQNI